jgi:peroxiredoxin/phage anti-repressor protein
MKKYSLIFLIFSFFFQSAMAQDAVSILKKAEEFCKTIQWGSYEMDVTFKGLMSTDTTVTKYDCKYSKLEADSISPASFRVERHWQKKLSHTYIYSGEDFIYLFARDSTGDILSKELWPAEVKKAIKEANLFRPLTARSKPVFFSGEDFTDTANLFIAEKDEKINGRDCYHIRIINKEKSNTSGFAVNQVTFDLWITKDYYLPIQYATTIDMMNGNMPMQQYALYTLKTFSINWPDNKKKYDITDAPAYYRLKNYEPYQRKEQLINGSTAPALSGKNIDGKKISLDDYKGKVVLIDFFYMACAPCILSFPHIKAIYRKYADSGVVVLGVNPVDKKEAQVRSFLKKYEIPYPVIFPDDELITKNYIIQGYPCFYLVDKKGKIAFSLPGYGQGVEALIEENIRKLIQE